MFVTGAVFVLLFLLPLFERVLNSGNIIAFSVGVVLILFGFIWNNIYFPLKIIFSIMIFAVLLFFAIMIALIIRAGSKKSDVRDVVIVLGCRVKGNVASRELVKRVDCAYKYLKANENCIAIVSGGKGEDENISEAQCMKQLLCEKGIAENRILCEDKSVSTDENIRFSAQIMEKHAIKKEVAIATSLYHQMRAGMICKKYKISAVPVSSKTKPTLLGAYLLREVFAIINEKMFS